MVGAPIDIVVLTDEPFQASYLASILEMEMPGLFRVRHLSRQEAGGYGHADLVLMQGDVGSTLRWPNLASTAKRAPVIVVARGAMDLSALDRLIHAGADDVLDIAQLNPRALAAAVLKTVRRSARNLAAKASYLGTSAAAP